jgi:hypothetical protein
MWFNRQKLAAAVIAANCLFFFAELVLSEAEGFLFWTSKKEMKVLANTRYGIL